jgi:hypothetical protein
VRQLSLFLIGMVLLPGWGAAEHNPLLPRPQDIHYGDQQLPVPALAVHFAGAPSPEDRFAAEALNGCFARRGVAALAITEESVPGRGILLKREGAGPDLPMPDERPGPESREAYGLSVTPKGVEIRAHSSTGLFYGVQTLCQLAEGEGADARLPEVEIRDWPALAYRGVMMDMSHGPLPTEEEVKRQLDFLARWKENQYYFYNEASIELDGYPLLNPHGQFTKEQIRRIIAYGRERHIDVIPCLELYGHMHDLFRIEKYSDLAALPHGGEFNPANPQVLALLTDWVNQFSELFPSPFVHIGFDETWEIERAAREQGAGATPAKLFVRQLGNVARLFQQHGKHVMLWGDIPIKYAEILAELPSGLTVVAWEYEPSDPEYKRWMEPLSKRHLPHFIASGVNSWDEIASDFPLAFENIDTFLVAGHKSQALGLMNTVWSDDAQLLLRLSWPAIAYGAAAPWQSSPMDRTHFFSDYASVMYPPATAPEVAAALESLAKAEVSLQKVLGQETMLELWKDPFTPAALKHSAEHREDLRQTRLLAEDAEEHLLRALARGADPAALNSLLIGSRLLDYAGMKFQYAVEISERWRDLGPHPTGDQFWVLFESEVTTSDHARLADLMDAISELREPYRNAWLQEYMPYRLASALGRWDAEYEYWRRLQARFRAFLASYPSGEPLPSLEAVISGR